MLRAGQAPEKYQAAAPQAIFARIVSMTRAPGASVLSRCLASIWQWVQARTDVYRHNFALRSHRISQGFSVIMAVESNGRGVMLVTTTEQVAGYRTKETLGQCFGVVVRSRGLGGNIMAGLRSIVGGEIHEYTQLLEEARRHAVDRLVTNATVMGANGVVMMRFDSAEIGQTMSEIVAYGTAVVLEPEDPKANVA
jgi:uncharacterized protein YbjQ (UPF0145 family)